MSGDLKKGKSSRVVVLGLDGVPFTLLEKLSADGIMPHFSEVAARGALMPMTASVPEVSSTSWSTFMTAVNPGRHGIFGFMELDRRTYDWRFPNFLDLKSPTLWEIAGRHGLRSVVINIPSTYPAKPLRGKLVSGFVAPDFEKAVYPPEFGMQLRQENYRLDVDARRAATDMDGFVKDIGETFRVRAEVICRLLDNQDWDLFIAAVTETDRLHHYLWSALEDASHPRHEFFIEFYRELDRFIGSFCSRIGLDTPLVLLSDHGFTSIRTEIYLNVFLRQKGYLQFSDSEPKSFVQMRPESTAFVLDPSRIYIHRTGAYSKGCVSERQYDEVRLRLTEDLLSLEVDGRKVIRQVHGGSDLYHGPLAQDGPDLVAMPHEGFDLKGSIARNSVSGRSLLTGSHTWENALLYLNRQCRKGDVNIVDAGATVLDLLGLDDVPVDGRSLCSS